MITLDAKIIPIQEVVVRIVNPLRLLRDMKENIRKNYPQSPAYLTTFYREGIERKNKFVGLTEAVFKIYKSAYKPNPAPDQVKLLKNAPDHQPAGKRHDHRPDEVGNQRQPEPGLDKRIA